MICELGDTKHDKICMEQLKFHVARKHARNSNSFTEENWRETGDLQTRDLPCELGELFPVTLRGSPRSV